MKAIVYARYSTDRQSEASIDDQVRVCREYAAARAWPVAALYTDEGISGAALGNRPGVRSALAQAGAGDVLLVTDLSRLSRSQDLAPLLSRLRHRGARVIGVQDGFDSDARHARMQAGLSGIMSEEFRAMVSDRTRSALELRARTGQPTGGKAYSDPAIVREVFARFADGDTLKAIVCDLNARGIPSPGAGWKQRSTARGKWLVSALHELLHNELYVGRRIWNRSQWFKDPDTGKRIRRERPPSEWIVQAVEPIVDEVTFERAQARFRPRGGGRGGVPRYLLSGLLECELCGSKLIVYGGSQHRYICGAYHAGGPHACENESSVPRTIAEDGILEPVIDDMLAPAAIDEGVTMLREERARAEHRPERSDREAFELERLVREGVLSAETAAPALEAARRRSRERRAAEASLVLPWPSSAAWKTAAMGMRSILTGEDVPAARAVLQKLVGVIPCRPVGDKVRARLSAREVLLATGSGRWIGSGGALLIYLPTSTRGRSCSRQQ